MNLRVAVGLNKETQNQIVIRHVVGISLLLSHGVINLPNPNICYRT